MKTSSGIRGRPVTFDRTAALNAATPLFWQHGYDGTSIAMLATALGCTAPTIYAAFGSKEGLYRDVVDHYRLRGPASQRAQPAAPSAYDMVERYLREVARQFTDAGHPKGCMVGTGALQCGPGSDTIAQYATIVRTEGHRLFAARIEDAKQRGELSDEVDAEALARFYIAIVQGMSVQAIDGANKAQLEALVDIALAAWPVRRA